MIKAPVQIAFYAPLKHPGHSAPSGDRTVARLLLSALALAGFSPELASELRTFEPQGDRIRQEAIRQESLREAARLCDLFGNRAPENRPRLWFTYHCYYKAPDWIGPAVADALRIPYVVAEGSRAGKRAAGPWSLAHEGAEAALDRADMIFVMTGHDGQALVRRKPAGQRLVSLPPFLDLGHWPAPISAGPRKGEPIAIRLLCVAMMREGDKLASFRLLADALRMLDDLGPAYRLWSLTVVGDGPARAEVDRLFAPLADRVDMHGQVEDRTRLAAIYDKADLLVWPAVNEAYGMALLEAQAMGCPVLAGEYGGVASAVKAGESGWLTAPGDVGAFVRTLADLMAKPNQLTPMRETAQRFVRRERDLDQAAARLRGELGSLLRSA